MSNNNSNPPRKSRKPKNKIWQLTHRGVYFGGSRNAHPNIKKLSPPRLRLSYGTRSPYEYYTTYEAIKQSGKRLIDPLKWSVDLVKDYCHKGAVTGGQVIRYEPTQLDFYATEFVSQVSKAPRAVLFLFFVVFESGKFKTQGINPPLCGVWC